MISTACTCAAHDGTRVAANEFSEDIEEHVSFETIFLFFARVAARSPFAFEEPREFSRDRRVATEELRGQFVAVLEHALSKGLSL